MRVSLAIHVAVETIVGGRGAGMATGDLAVAQILRETCYDNSRVFFLGPFAKRINFVAQQVRALNLVYALRKQSRLEHEKSIAVVGAGLSGLTIATALTLLGYLVHVFEKKGEVLFRQRYTAHRIVHPTIHAWPDHETLDPTISLPFFDWCTNQCDSVMIRIAQEWSTICKELIEDDRFHAGTKVIDYNEIRGGVALTTEPGIRTLPEFGTVIFAIGFEDETIITNIPAIPKRSYWVDDDLERLRGESPDLRFIVTGTGDGGLIDSLRLIHGQFYKGTLPIKTATDLFQSPAATAISEAERKFRSHEISEARLQEVYEECAEYLPQGVIERLEASIIKIRPLVYLIGRRSTPYGRDAAPIHKLLVAYAIRHGFIKYIQGHVSLAENNDCLIETDSELTKPNMPAIPAKAVVVRHGAVNALDDLLRNRPNVLRYIQQHQQVLADDMVEPYWADADIPSPGQAIYKPDDTEFLGDRFKRASRMINEFWPYMRLSWKLGTRFVTATNIDDKHKWRPKSLFGIPVDWEQLYVPAQGIL